MAQILGKRGKVTKTGNKFVRTTSPIYNRSERKMLPSCFRPDTVHVYLYKNILLPYYIG